MRRVFLVGSISALCASRALAQAGANPEIFLVPLSVAHGAITVGKPTNVTNRPGYDNQPSFAPDGRALVYTSTRDDAQADIYRYDIATKKSERVTTTAPESEYSATFLPDHHRFSVIRVEKDSAQRLWSFAPDGTDPRIVLTDIKPVGYHAWLDAHHLALFVLGAPNSLMLADTRTGKGEVLARDIGRSLLRLPSGHGFTFLSHHGADWVLTEVRLNASNDSVRYIRPIVTLPAGMDYVAWVNGRVIGGTGTRLMSWIPGGQWIEIADFAHDGLTRLSRITVSPNGRMLAIVAELSPNKP